MELKIAKAKIEDAEAIRRVYADAYRENRELGFPASAETATVNEIAQWIHSDRVWIAMVGDEVVGAARLRASDPEYPTLGRLGVLSKFKGAGVGKALMDAVEADARQRGCKGITLTVAEEHPFLSKIYRKRGYQIMGPREPQHALYNEIVMRKSF